MLVSTRNKWVFIHNPKTAGTSITSLLRQIDPSAELLKNKTHMPARYIKYLIEERGELWTDYYSFGFIRNPYERLHSLYHFIINRYNGTETERIRQAGFGNWLKHNYNIYEERQTSPGETPIPNTQKSQLNWFSKSKIEMELNGNHEPIKLITSFLGRYEHLHRDLELILESITGDIDPPRPSLPCLQDYNRDKDYKKVYRVGDRQWVDFWFRPEIEKFGYKF